MQGSWIAHMDDVKRYCLSMARDGFEADELAQTALLKGFTHQELLDNMSDAACKAWLFKTAKNTLIDIRRRERYIAPFASTPELTYNDDLSVVEVAELMSRLPHDQSELLSLRYMSGMNSTQIGEYLGIPSATVRTRLRAAIRALRRENAK